MIKPQKRLGNLVNRFKSIISLISNNQRFISQIKKSQGRIRGKMTLKIYGLFELGKKIVIGGEGIDLFKRTQIIICKGATLRIGDYSGMTSVSIFCKKGLTIGKNVNIGAGTLIIDSDFHSLNWEDRTDRFKDVINSNSKEITIGDYAFIGSRCVILKGVNIGVRSIIAAGSVVTKDIPADCVAGGNPCVVIRQCEFE